MNMPIYIISLIDNNKYCITNGYFTIHLRQHNLTFREYYETYITGVCPLCECSRSLTFKQNNIKSTYSKTCGDPKCVGKIISHTKQNWTKEEKEKDANSKSAIAAKRTKKEKREIRKKIIKKCLKKYKVKYYTQSEEFKEKSKKTKIKRHNNPNYNNSEKTQQINLNKSAKEKNKINKKRKRTNIKRHNTPNPFMCKKSTVASGKSNSTSKEYKLPSGKIIQIRGYENKVLDILLKTYNESELLIHDSSIQYNLPTFEFINHTGRNYTYYPDIYIQHKNKIIEVKASYWWDGNGNASKKYQERLDTNMRKRQAVLDDGYIFELWLYTDKNSLEVLSNEEDFYKWTI